MRTPARTFFETILIVALILAFAVAPKAAQAACDGHHHGMGPGQGHGPVPFAEFDGDGDGFVSEAEFATTRGAHMAAMAQAGRPMQGAASAPAFADIDSDGDGQLTEGELAAGHKAHMKAMRKTHKDGGHGKGKHGKGKHAHGGKDMKLPTFTDLDLNGDGCIDADEFAAHQAAHHPEMAE